jgi:Gram-negative bacterial TonB protein C-terminal
MLPCFRALRLCTVLLSVSCIQLRAQDMPTRVEAVQLLERANGVIRPSHIMPNLKLQARFRAYGLDESVKEGTFEAIYTVDSERYEYVFGNYHAIALHLPDRIVQNDYQAPPPEIGELDGLTPLTIGHFDKSDTIHSISPATLFGHRAKCIQFETVNGRTHQSNEICVDEELGSVVRWNVGEDLVELTEYFQLEGVLHPAHIRHYINGKLRMEIEQKFTVIDEPIDWAALTPPKPTVLTGCKQYRRPVLQSAQQPPNAGPGPWYDVQVHGAIGEDGHVYQAAVLPAGRPDLEKQAVEIVSGWLFSPAICGGKPIGVHSNFVVHFPLQ